MSLSDIGERLADITRRLSGPQVHTGDPLTDIGGLLANTRRLLADTDHHAGIGDALADAHSFKTA